MFALFEQYNEIIKEWSLYKDLKVKYFKIIWKSDRKIGIGKSDQKKTVKCVKLSIPDKKKFFPSLPGERFLESNLNWRLVKPCHVGFSSMVRYRYVCYSHSNNVFPCNPLSNIILGNSSLSTQTSSYISHAVANSQLKEVDPNLCLAAERGCIVITFITIKLELQYSYVILGCLQ